MTIPLLLKFFYMKRHTLVLLLSIIYSTCIFAQINKDHNIVTASGKIPEQIISNPQKKFWKDLSDKKYKKQDADKNEKDFLLENSFYTTKMLSSGYVLFNDGVTKYLQEIANEIIKVDPSLKEVIKVYTIKSPYVNAYCTYEGVVLVNLGLVAQCENESQLAFILCHEIAHYQRKHMKDKYFEMLKMKKGEGAYKYMTAEQKFFAKNYYSQDKEREADSLGLELYMKTPYYKKDLINTFDVLRYAQTPFDEIKYSTHYFEDDFYKIPSNYLLSDVQYISSIELDSNNKSTHPVTKQRKAMIQNVLKANKSVNLEGSKFIVGEPRFIEVRNEARYETSRLENNNLNYVSSLYNSYLLQRQDPNDRYLKVNIANALLGISKYATARVLDKISPDYEDVEGEEQSAHYMIMKMAKNPVELCILATKMTYESYRQDTTNLFMKLAFINLVADLEVVYNHKLADFSPDTLNKQRVYKDSILNYERTIFDLSQLDSSKFANLSKYEKLRYNRQINKWKKEHPDKFIEKSNTGDEDYYYSAFVKYFNDPFFVKTFLNKEEELLKRKQERDKIIAKMRKNNKSTVIKPAKITTVAENKKISEKKKSKIEASNTKEKNRVKNEEEALVNKELDKKKKPLAIKKVVVVKPTYDVVNEFRANQVRHIKGFQKREKYIEIINEVSGVAKLKLDVLDHMRLKEDDIDKFNDLALLSEIISERLAHLDNVSMPMISDSKKTTDLIKKYDTKYFLWTGVVNVAKKRSPLMWISAAYVVSIPILAALYATPKYETYYYSIVYDLESGEMKIVDLKRMPLRDKKALLKNNFYNTLHNIKYKKF